jgi:hypothetical protein
MNKKLTFLSILILGFFAKFAFSMNEKPVFVANSADLAEFEASNEFSFNKLPLDSFNDLKNNDSKLKEKTPQEDSFIKLGKEFKLDLDRTNSDLVSDEDQITTITKCKQKKAEQNASSTSTTLPDIEIFTDPNLNVTLKSYPQDLDNSCPFKINASGLPQCRACKEWCADKDESILATCKKCKQKIERILNNTVAIIVPEKIYDKEIMDLRKMLALMSAYAYPQDTQTIENKHVFFAVAKENQSLYGLLFNNPNIVNSLTKILNIVRRNTQDMLIYPQPISEDLKLSIPQKFSNESKFISLLVKDTQDSFPYILIVKKI